MFVRACRRLIALTFILSLCLGPVSALAASRVNDPGRVTAPVLGGSLSSCGDPDRGVGSPPLQKADDRMGANGERGSEWWSLMARWFTGLLQRNGFRF